MGHSHDHHAHTHDHGCSHDHGHSHGHHHHAPPDSAGIFLAGILLNGGFVIAEFLYGWWANSLALLADAVHNAGDVAGLLMAGGAVLLARRKPSSRFTYGLQGSSIIAALANATLLLVITGGIGWQAIVRFMHPAQTAPQTVMEVAACGIVINGLTAILFMAGRKRDLNMRATFLHMLSDALISAGVVGTGLAIMATGWLWLDPAVSLAISFLILMGTWDVLKDSIGLALQAVPREIAPENVRAYLNALPGIAEIHDLHIWAMSTTETALTAHLLMPGGYPGSAFIQDISRELEHRFGIGHSTIQIEVSDSSTDCGLAARHPG
jgi:cobalt-zinc-cadmium efflux system protein